MRWSHVERRSYKYAAVQYVSETHDHKPDAPAKKVTIVLRRMSPEQLAERRKLMPLHPEQNR
jgi:hypothetical protein